SNQGMSLNNLNLNSIGNIFNLLFSIALLLGIMVLIFQKREVLPSVIVFRFTVVMTAVLTLAYIFTNYDLPLKQIYFFNQPIQKVIIGVLFVSYQFVQFLLINLIWANIISRKNVFYFRSVTNALSIIFLISVFAFIYAVNMGDKLENIKIKKSDNNIAVVLGAAVWSNNKPSPSLAARVDKAVELYKERYVNKIQLTGSNAPGELPEAEVAYRYLRQDGIPDENVLLETKTTSTTEQISFIRFYLTQNSSREIIVISDKYHLPRVMEICVFYNIKVKPVASNLQFSVRTNIYHRIRETIALTMFWFFAI
ncbi:MAG: YdcF family protein, partial [Ignavibacteriaceae bacterium]|nr:YdcF family protein [Ignavibacteriaceae bacterium]